MELTKIKTFKVSRRPRPFYELSAHPELFHRLPMDDLRFRRFLKDLGFSVSLGDELSRLFACGFLRADLIETDTKVEKITGCRIVTHGNNRSFNRFVDFRTPKTLRNGWGGVLRFAKQIPKEIDVYFHPFRAFTIYHLHRILSPNLYFLQYLINEDKQGELAAMVESHHRDWSCRSVAANKLLEWCEISELAIACEPISYPYIHGRYTWRLPDSEDEAQGKRERYFQVLARYLRRVGLDRLEECRRSLVVAAESVDKNKILHVLVRLMHSRERERLKGEIALSNLFLEMAESIRRVAEEVFETRLPEEDELGFGQWMEGARRRLYGTERVLDAPLLERAEFVRGLGLEFGIRGRLYLEGDTELGFFGAIISQQGAVELKNIRGRWIGKGPEGLYVLDSLKADCKAKVFSFLCLDGDRDDTVRAARRAESKGLIIGDLLVSTPDFEFAYFSVSELVDVWVEWIGEDWGRSAVDREEALRAVEDASDARQMFAGLRTRFPEFERYAKGKEWGERLVRYLSEECDLEKLEEVEDPKARLAEFVRKLLRCRHFHYELSKEQIHEKLELRQPSSN